MLDRICDFLDRFLEIDKIEDHPNALNGLQLENNGRVTKIGAAVDACEATIELAVRENVDLLLVHHGLFWGGLSRITGAYHRKLRRSMAANLAIYSAHLPLDLHFEIGNNVLLANALNLPGAESLSVDGKRLGVYVSTELDLRELLTRLRDVLSRDPWVCASGPETVRHVAIVTGGASGLGAATSAALAKQGAHVYALDLTAGVEKAPSVDGVQYVATDVTVPFEVQAAVDAAAGDEYPLRVAFALLKPGGRVLILQPNIRLIGGAYWDFIDHQTALTEKSLAEAAVMAGFKTRQVIPRFLPYTTKSRIPQHPLLVRAYLAFPPAWWLLGKQTLYLGEKPI